MLLTLPTADELLAPGSPALPRQVRLEDLLGRTPVQLDAQGLNGLFTGQTVLVTGAGGSIGAELCRQVARFGVARLVCVDVSEYATYTLEQELQRSFPLMQGVYYTANVRELGRLRAIAMEHRPSVVLHAAAYKHVPLMEAHNEIEALRTNVLGSSGSVVPLFTAQVELGGPVTVTHPDIVRYFMTIPEAAQLVLQAGLMGQSGQIFVLDMGEPMKIVELARLLIRMSGKSEAEVPIAFTGLRPGEKLYEELLADDETTEPTPHPKLRVAKVAPPAGEVAAAVEAWLAAAGAAPDAAAIRRWLRQRVPEYQAGATG